MPRELPARFGRYVLESVLGEGGMAVVYRAVLHGPAGFQKRVAIKIAHQRDDRPWSVPSLYAEGRIAGRLRHRHVVDVYEMGDVEGQPYIAMELVEGLTLSRLIRSASGRPDSVNCAIGLAIARGLRAAHELQDGDRPLGLVHRDLKPSNVLLAWDGSVKIADFGIATLREADDEDDDDGSPCWGTPAYMSPEQARSDDIDARSDLFSLGILLGELVLGRAVRRSGVGPHPWADPQSTDLHAIDDAMPGLGPIVFRCVQSDPADRYPDARTVLEALQRVQARVPPRPDLATWMSERKVQSEQETGYIGAVAALPPLHSPPHLSTLPPIDTSFIGRAAERASLAAAIAAPGSLVTLVGPGGIGKTRLALEHAHAQRRPGAGHVWFCDVTEARSLDDLVSAGNDLLALRLQGVEVDDRITELGQALRMQGTGLWIWDNVEQVVEAMAVLIPRMVELAPDLQFLCTSREPLRIQGEQRCLVGPLSPEESEALFRSRSQKQQTGETNQTAQALAAVTRHCDGMPLALELAASRTRLMGVKQLAERLPEPLKVLRSRDRSRPDRHQSMRQNLAWSWELLEPWEQQAMAQMSVFRGGFRLESAEAVVDLSGIPGAPWMVEVVECLLDKSLLRSRQTGTGPRFSMFMMVQAYASEQLEEYGSEVAAGSRQRHAEHFASLGAEVLLRRRSLRDARLDGPDWLATLNNLKAAFSWSKLVHQSDQIGQCALAIAEIFWSKGPLDDGRTYLSAAMELPVSRRLRIRLLACRARSGRIAGRSAEAVQDLEDALVLTDEWGQIPERAVLLCLMGEQMSHVGDHSQAKVFFSESLTAFQDAAEGGGRTDVLTTMASAYQESGSYEEGEAMARQALTTSRAIGDKSSEALALNSLAANIAFQNRQPEAEAHWRAAIEISVSQGERTCFYLMNLAAMRGAQNDLSGAIEHSELALVQLRALGYHRATATCLGNLGRAQFELGNPVEAQRWWEESLQYSLISGTKIDLIHSLLRVGGLADGLGDAVRGAGAFAEAREIAERMGMPLPMPIFRSVPLPDAQLATGVAVRMVLHESGDGAVFPSASEHVWALCQVARMRLVDMRGEPPQELAHAAELVEKAQTLVSECREPSISQFLADLVAVVRLARVSPHSGGL